MEFEKRMFGIAHVLKQGRGHAVCMGLLLAVCAEAAFAQVKVPPMAGLLNDTAAMVPAGQRPALEQRLADFSAATGGGQLVVLTIPALEGEDIEGYAMRVAEAWKPGRKGVDDGALLLLVRDDRRSRLEIGYGWEGDINDARAGDVLRNIAAYLAQDKAAEGIASAVGQIQAYVTGAAPEDAPPVLSGQAAGVVPVSEPMTPEEKAIAWFWFGLFVLLFCVSQRFRRVVFFILSCCLSSSGGSGGRGGGGSSRGGGGGFGGGGASGRW